MGRLNVTTEIYGKSTATRFIAKNGATRSTRIRWTSVSKEKNNDQEEWSKTVQHCPDFRRVSPTHKVNMSFLCAPREELSGVESSSICATVNIRNFQRLPREC